MTAADLTDEQRQANDDELAAAIRKYRETVEPGNYVDGWVLITHNLTAALEIQDASIVSLAIPRDQSFPLTRGMLEIALQRDQDRIRQ